MNRIKLLPPEVAQKIAAGEVIERPVSIVKELVENSLDAGADEIRVDLVAGGKKLIRVQDNGHGMSRDDAVLCFRRHSTSKISGEEDLEKISTLGFRGEALASIAAVSILTLKTSDGAEGQSGTVVEKEGDKLISVTDVAFPKGTTIEVRDIFFNLPARRKFLRSERSELGFVTRYLTVAALAYPGVRFILIHGERRVMDCPAVAGLRERIYQLYGKDLVSRLMDVDHTEGENRIFGLASKPIGGRGDRNLQFFFVNGRPIKDRTLQAALNQAYLPILEKDHSPEAFLFLTIPFSDVDVNVHPAKAEVRFLDSQAVFRLVLRGLDRAASRMSGIKEVYASTPADCGPESRVEESGTGLPFSFSGPGYDDKRGERRMTPASSAPAPAEEEALSGPRVLGQYLAMYIIAVSDEEGVLVIDQHNAHERILYEKFVEVDRKKIWPHKLLLVPEIIDLSPSQVLDYEENRTLFEEAGFLLEPMSGRSYALKELPDVLGIAAAREYFLSLLEDVGAEKPDFRREKLLRTMACKAAVKAGEILPREKMEYLVEELFKTSQPSLCPHGRPVVVKIERGEIDRGLRRA